MFVDENAHSKISIYILPNIQIVLLQLIEMKIHELKSFATRRRQFSNLNEWNLCQT